MKILIGTKNPGKIEGRPVNSNVGDQPINEEILQGAKNRVKNIKVCFYIVV